MHQLLKHCIAPATLALSIGTAAAAPPPEPRTAAAVLATDNAWGEAEAHGDVGFVNALLLPAYRSVSQNGKVTDKAAILASTRKKGGTPERAAEIAAWRAEHPSRGVVTLFGDTAVLTWEATGSSPGTVMSCDIFVYREGRWHAVYSQHSNG